MWFYENIQIEFPANGILYICLSSSLYQPHRYTLQANLVFKHYALLFICDVRTVAETRGSDRFEFNIYCNTEGSFKTQALIDPNLIQIAAHKTNPWSCFVNLTV